MKINWTCDYYTWLLYKQYLRCTQEKISIHHFGILSKKMNRIIPCIQIYGCLLASRNTPVYYRVQSRIQMKFQPDELSLCNRNAVIAAASIIREHHRQRNINCTYQIFRKSFKTSGDWIKSANCCFKFHHKATIRCWQTNSGLKFIVVRHRQRITIDNHHNFGG